MHYRKLGNTGITVSDIGFGGWAIGGATEASGTPLGWGKTNDDDSLEVIGKSHDHPTGTKERTTVQTNEPVGSFFAYCLSWPRSAPPGYTLVRTRM